MSRIASRPLKNATTDWILHTVVDVIGDMYVSHVNGIVAEGEALDELVLVFSAEDKEDVLRRVGLARHFVTNLLSHLWTKKELISVLINKENQFVGADVRVYMRDVLGKTIFRYGKLIMVTSGSY